MPSYPDDADGAVLARLAAHGVDMTQPLLIEFVVESPDEAASKAIENALKKEGYGTEVYFDEGEPDEEGEIDSDDEEFGLSWTVNATVKMVPEYAEIMRIQSDLDRIASPFGGKSDGWGVMMD